MNLAVTVEKYLSEVLPLIEQTLHDLIPADRVPYESLYQASRYALDGGKRLRPLLMLAVLEGFDIPLHKGLYPACALELIHCYSLIHDDLPCMDDDDFRRGKPSLHRAFPESHAILTGDYLLTYAFEILCQAPELSSMEKLSLINTLSHLAGSKGMIGGQIMDMEVKEIPHDSSFLLQMQVQKTGSLMVAALEFGAIIAHQDLLPFKKIGEKLGLGFQIYDDIVDKEKNRANIVFHLGEQEAREYFKRISREVITEIRSLSPSLTLLEELIRVFVLREIEKK